MASVDVTNALEERLIAFAVRIIKVTSALPRTPAGRHLAGQILRCGTSPAPNYGEARGAESREDFVHKLKIILKELNETSIWLRIIIQAKILKPVVLANLLDENKQLCKIINKSITTSLSRMDRPIEAMVNDQ